MLECCNLQSSFKVVAEAVVAVVVVVVIVIEAEFVEAAEAAVVVVVSLVRGNPKNNRLSNYIDAMTLSYLPLRNDPTACNGSKFGNLS